MEGWVELLHPAVLAPVGEGDVLLIGGDVGSRGGCRRRVAHSLRHRCAGGVLRTVRGRRCIGMRQSVAIAVIHHLVAAEALSLGIGDRGGGGGEGAPVPAAQQVLLDLFSRRGRDLISDLCSRRGRGGRGGGLGEHLLHGGFQLRGVLRSHQALDVVVQVLLRLRLDLPGVLLVHVVDDAAVDLGRREEPALAHCIRALLIDPLDQGARERPQADQPGLRVGVLVQGPLDRGGFAAPTHRIHHPAAGRHRAAADDAAEVGIAEASNQVVEGVSLAGRQTSQCRHACLPNLGEALLLGVDHEVLEEPLEDRIAAVVLGQPPQDPHLGDDVHQGEGGGADQSCRCIAQLRLLVDRLAVDLTSTLLKA